MISKTQTHTYYDLSFGLVTMICDRIALKESLVMVKPDVVFHLAGRIEVGESVKHPTEFYAVNTGGTINLLTAMQALGINNLIYWSTTGVYEPSEEEL
jgi:UDP-glucose 4-epimerase